MQLPPAVKRIVEERAEAVGFAALKRAAAAMSEAYREGRVARLADAERTAAYLVTRMPATYAAAHAVLRQVQARLDPAKVASILDVGAGTGAASLAASEWFPDAAITMVERDAAFSQMAGLLVPRAATQVAAMPATLAPHDLVIAAYSLGEMREPMLQRLWQAARVALVVIEPGTPAGFTFVRSVREELLAAGARMVAPCPMESGCPIAAPDWCHFSARVERSSLHRQVKGGSLGHEDEKYSYVALAREPVALTPARVVRHPQHQPGLIVLETCTPAGLGSVRVLKRDREQFRAARKVGWGDDWLS